MIFVDDANDTRLDAYHNIKEKDLVGRQSRFIAEGKVVLQVLLNSALFEAESLLITENKIVGLSDLLQHCPAHVPVYCVHSEIMDQIAGFNVHRGILAVGKRKTAPDAATLLSSLQDDALIVLLCGISNHDNIGSIFRNAAAFEAAGIILDQTCCDPLYRKAIRVSVGGTLQVPYSLGGTIDELTTIVAQAGYNLIALSPQSSHSIYELPSKGRTALLLGTEGEGLPQHLLQSLQTARIPMSRQFDSLNVATASGIALSYLSRSFFS